MTCESSRQYTIEPLWQNGIAHTTNEHVVSGDSSGLPSNDDRCLTTKTESSMGYQKIQVPASGDKITVNADNTLNVPDNPIIPYIEGTASALTSAR